jgi:hypothetical protein
MELTLMAPAMTPGPDPETTPGVRETPLFAPLETERDGRSLLCVLGAGGLELALLVLLLLVTFVGSKKVPPPPPPGFDHNKVVTIDLGVKPPEPPSKPKASRATPVVKETRSYDLVPPTNVPHQKQAKVTADWAPDREQAMPLVIALRNATVGFARDKLVVRRFSVTGTPIEVPAGGLNLRSFYYMGFDESGGYYSFLADIRNPNPSLSSLVPYALFDAGLQIEIENEIRKQAACPEGSDLAATLKLGVGPEDQGRGFHIVGPVRCAAGGGKP